MADAEYKRLTCERCSINFTNPRATKYCSRMCRDGTKQTRSEWLTSIRSGAKGSFECEHCGEKSYRGISGSSGIANRFCSMACRSGFSIAAEVVKNHEKARICEIRKLAKALVRIANQKQPKPNPIRQPCVVCGKKCEYVPGGKKLYCSRKCKVSTDAVKELRRANRGKRKALMRGVHAESFAPSAVFDRDGWKCQICGVSTPKSRRGTMHANAPELDHIIPLSKGGNHTKANTQCACRSCNGWKSNRLVVGQVGLFTSFV